MHRTEKHAVRLVKGSCDRVFMRAFGVYVHAARTVIEHIEISERWEHKRKPRHPASRWPALLARSNEKPGFGAGFSNIKPIC